MARNALRSALRLALLLLLVGLGPRAWADGAGIVYQNGYGTFEGITPSFGDAAHSCDATVEAYAVSFGRTYYTDGRPPSGPWGTGTVSYYGGHRPTVDEEDIALALGDADQTGLVGIGASCHITLYQEEGSSVVFWEGDADLLPVMACYNATAGLYRVYVNSCPTGEGIARPFDPLNQTPGQWVDYCQTINCSPYVFGSVSMGSGYSCAAMDNHSGSVNLVDHAGVVVASETGQFQPQGCSFCVDGAGAAYATTTACSGSSGGGATGGGSTGGGSTGGGSTGGGSTGGGSTGGGSTGGGSTGGGSSGSGTVGGSNGSGSVGGSSSSGCAASAPCDGWSGTCAGGFHCTGDAVQCAQAQAAYTLACSLGVDTSNAAAASAVSTGQAAMDGSGEASILGRLGVGSAASGVEFNLSSMISESPLFGGGGCPAPTSFTVLGRAYAVGVPCDLLAVIGVFDRGLALLIAAFIVFRKGR